MARSSLAVTYESTDPARMPDAFIEPVALFLDLRGRGVLDELGRRLRIRRQGGYCGLDVWLALLTYFAAGLGGGVKALWDRLRPHARQVAGVAGRRSLPSPPSLSRALESVETELLRPEADWLLAGVADIDPLLGHPAVQTYDAVGQGWHVFDLDPTVKALRHRALPERDDLPEPRRRSEDAGAPGYAGRKRGDVVFRRITVQHAGSGAWLHAHLSRGNGQGVADLGPALDTVAATCDRLGAPRARALVRMDGEYGGVPAMTACRQRSLPFVTRLTRPALFEDPEVLARLRGATWHEVPDSLSGPRRAAADLGLLTVRPGERTRRPDGGRYEPVEVRVVASIFPNDGEATRGRTIDGWQVELFAVDLPVAAWPAPEAVTAYFGRNGQENRFAQEDRELGLDRIVSYHLPGQELATLVGLALWNLRLCRGFEADRPPTERPEQAERQAVVDSRVPEQWPRDPVIVGLVGKLDPERLLRRRPGWSVDAAAGRLCCEDGRTLALSTVRPGEHAAGRTGIVFIRPKGGCQDCQARHGCLRSDAPDAAKHAELSAPTAVAAGLRARLAELRRPSALELRPLGQAAGGAAVVDTLFLPASARRAYGRWFLGASCEVVVTLPDPEPRLRLVAGDVAGRQRRRKTWDDNLARNALPHDADVRVVVRGGPQLRRLCGQSSEASASRSGRTA